MENTKLQFDDEIDLLELFKTLWDGKWKIIGAVTLSLLSVFAIQSSPLRPSFKAVTEIKPVTSDVADRYRQMNALGFFEVKPHMLLNLYIEQLEELTLFQDAITEHNLLDKNDFDDEQSFKEATVLLSSSVKLLPPTEDSKKRGVDRRYWTLEFEYNDEEKWKKVLSSVSSLANESVRKILEQRFRTSLDVAKQKRDFELEDLEIQITNAMTDYDRIVSDRLAYLSEQASIARKLGVAKNTIEAQTFSTSNGMVANFKTDTPFYLRGYEAIEKEIELIKSRSQKEAFIKGLLELEQKKRSLEQDMTLERAQDLFNSTPIIDADEFVAVSFLAEATEFKTRNMMMLALAIVIGGIFGVFLVLISSAIRKRNQLSA